MDLLTGMHCLTAHELHEQEASQRHYTPRHCQRGALKCGREGGVGKQDPPSRDISWNWGTQSRKKGSLSSAYSCSQIRHHAQFSAACGYEQAASAGMNRLDLRDESQDFLSAGECSHHWGDRPMIKLLLCPDLANLQVLGRVRVYQVGCEGTFTRSKVDALTAARLRSLKRYPALPFC